MAVKTWLPCLSDWIITYTLDDDLDNNKDHFDGDLRFNNDHTRTAHSNYIVFWPNLFGREKEEEQ